MSYGNEMTRDNNPLECGLGRYCQLDGSIDFIGRDVLMRISKAGPQRLLRGVLFDGDPCPPCATPWPVCVDGKVVGRITTAIWSPRFNSNIALGMLDAGIGKRVRGLRSRATMVRTVPVSWSLFPSRKRQTGRRFSQRRKTLKTTSRRLT